MQEAEIKHARAAEAEKKRVEMKRVETEAAARKALDKEKAQNNQQTARKALRNVPKSMRKKLNNASFQGGAGSAGMCRRTASCRPIPVL